MAVSEIEAHAAILLTCVANMITTLVGLKVLRRKINGHNGNGTPAGKDTGGHS